MFVTAFAMVAAACGGDDTSDTTAGGGSDATTTTAGGGDATTTTEAMTDDELIVGVSWNNYNEERWAKSDEPAIQAALAAAGATYISTDAGSSVEQQLADIEQLISQGADALIVLAQDGTAVLPGVQSALDQGIPVMWRMCSLDEYNAMANTNTVARENVTDWKAWKKRVAEQAEAFEKRDKIADKHHICMIIGYNAETEELAVSDSWGPRYELRWVPLEVANWVHNEGLFMILP